MASPALLSNDLSRLNIVDMIPSDDELPLAKGPHLHKNINGEPSLPNAFPKLAILQLIRKPGRIRINKLRLTQEICLLSRQPTRQLPLIRRSPGYGKTTFIHMAEFQLDPTKEDSFRALFSDIVASTPPLEDSLLSLRFDFSHFDPDPNILRSILDSEMNVVLTAFLHRYWHLFSMPIEKLSQYVISTASMTFLLVINLLKARGLKLLLFVDNFDEALVRSSLDNIHDIYQILHEYLDKPVTLARGKNFIGGGCFLGHPIDATITPPWVFQDSGSRTFLTKVCCDRTPDATIGHAFGMIPEEMQALGHELLGSDKDAARFVHDVPIVCPCQSTSSHTLDFLPFSSSRSLASWRLIWPWFLLPVNRKECL